MADEPLAPAAQGTEPTPERNDTYPLGRDPLDMMRALKLRTRLVVYPAVTALIPLSHFLLGISWLAAVVSHAVGGYVVATLGIEFGFWYGWRLRKEAAYPTMLAMDLGATGDFGCACERAVRLLAELLGAEKVALLWRTQEDGSLTTMSAHGIPPDAMADDSSLPWEQQDARQSIAERKVVVAPMSKDHPWQSASGSRSWIAYVPLLSLDKIVGLLVLVGVRRASDLRDKMLLAPIGLTMGLTLENLRHTVELTRRSDEYVATTNLTGDIIARLDKHGNWTFLNDAACQFFGKSREELLGTDSRAYVHPEDIELTAQSIRDARTKRKLVTGLVTRATTPMGTRVVEWNGYPLFDEEGQYAGIQITGRDVTERKEMEEALRENEARLRLITDNTSDLIWTMDLSLRYTYMSPAITRMRGYTVEEMVGLSGADAMTPASLELSRKTLAEELVTARAEDKDTSRTRQLELEMYCKDGSTIWTEMNMRWLRDSDGKPVGILGVTRDISRRKQMEEERERLQAELEVRAVTDGLTDLYNHAHFYQRLAEEAERSKRYKHGFAVLMMDVDNFKCFNDSRGHQAGDEMLRLVADSIRSGLRRSDVAFRYGGDEFAAILPHADSATAQAAVSRINRRITNCLKRKDGAAAACLSVSAGVACFPEDGSTADELVKAADAALYAAKWTARARDAMAEAYAIEELAPPAEMLRETQRGTVSSAAGSLAAALHELGVPGVLAELNRRTIIALGVMAEAKDPYVRGHQERTSDRAATLAEEMGLPPDKVRATRFAGLLHDLGKAGISRHILNKPGTLTEDEFAKVKEHSPLGSMMITSEIGALQELVPIVRHHHERFDGKGYPDGLAGQEIPLEARILAVVDAFDAMTHERSYRKALSKVDAVSELQRGAGTQFDPAVVQPFLALVGREDEEPGALQLAAGEEKELANARTTKR